MIRLFQAWMVRRIVRQPYTTRRFQKLKCYGVSRIKYYTLNCVWHHTWVSSLLESISVVDRGWINALDCRIFTAEQRWCWTIYSISTLHNPILAKVFFEHVSITTVTSEAIALFENMDDPWLFWILSKLTDWDLLPEYPQLESLVKDRIFKSHPIWFLGEYYTWASGLIKQINLPIPFWWWHILNPSPGSNCPRPDSFLYLRYTFAGGEGQQLIERKLYGNEELTRQRNTLLACHTNALMFSAFFGNLDIFQRVWPMANANNQVNALYVLRHYYINNKLSDRIEITDSTLLIDPLILGYCLDIAPMHAFARYLAGSSIESFEFKDVTSDVFSME